MDFKLTKEQSDIRKAAGAFAAGEFEPDQISDQEKKYQFPMEILQKACQLGFIGLHAPEKLGGQGLGHMENALVFEAFCRQDSSLGLALALCDMGAEVILRFGSDVQKQHFIPPLCQGKSILSPAYMEEGQHPTPWSYGTIAVKNSEGYLVNGAKTFVCHTILSGPMILFCRLIEGASDQPVCLLFEKDTRGFTSKDLGDRVGMKMVPMADVTFIDFGLPFESLLGEGHAGEAQWELFIMEMNARAAAIGTGIAQGAFDMALAYADRRKQFGRRIASFEAIRGRLTDMATRIEMARLLAYKASWCLDSKTEDAGLCYMAKVVAAETALDVCRDALHIFGGYGYVLDYRIERFYRDAGMVDIVGLPGYVNKKILAEYAVGKEAILKQGKAG